MTKKTTRAQLMKGSQTLTQRLKKDMKDPAFAAAFQRHTLEAEVAQQLHDLREKKHLTQKELAGRVGIKQPALGRIEQGRQNLTLGTIHALAGAMGYRVVVRFLPT